MATDAGYIGLVSSAKRADAMRDYLRTQGFNDDDLIRIHAPAGMDLGRIPNREIAAAVMADLVARRAQGELAADAAALPEHRPDRGHRPHLRHDGPHRRCPLPHQSTTAPTYYFLRPRVANSDSRLNRRRTSPDAEP